MSHSYLHRRTFISGASSAISASLLQIPQAGAAHRDSGLAVSALPLEQELSSIVSQAAMLGLSTPRTSLVQASRSALRLSLYLGDFLDQSLVKGKSGDAAASDFSDRVGYLISQITRSMRDPAEADPSLAARRGGPPFEQLQPEYKSLFQSCNIVRDHESELDIAAKKILSPDYQRRYNDVESDTAINGRPGVPWYVIGTLHYREANLNFMGHLHNGDYLKAKTTDVPIGRPLGPWPLVPWDAEKAWRVSAVDALEAYRDQADWTLERTLYTFESYNGWGYRSHKVPSQHRSPYV
jgi:lysozyme family protein